MTVPYNSCLNLEHFGDEYFVREMRKIFRHSYVQDSGFPLNKEQAKAWEITQAVRGLRDFGALTARSEVLGIAAGFEHTVFYLTNFVRRVFATDLYVTNEVWKEADRIMLSDPGLKATAGMTWNPRRLVVQHMNALELMYDDESFDGVFSSGSIEHYGTLENVAQSAREMGRVLRPGGVAAISTEFRISGSDEEIGVPGAIIFTPDMLREYIIGPSGLQLVDAPKFVVSEATKEAAYPISEAIAQGRSRSIALTLNDWAWTSVSLCLRKV